MKSPQALNLKTIALTKAMYATICRYVYQAFNDITEESDKNILSALLLINCDGLFQLEVLLRRPNKMVNQVSSKVTQDVP